MLDKSGFAARLAGLAGNSNVKLDEPMAKHTSFQVGGPADLFVTPGSTESLVEVYRLCIKEEVPVFVMGNGTNLIVRDKGIRGVVLQLLDNISDYRVEDGRIQAGSGILLSRLSRVAQENGLTGLEFAEGIPGTLGGAVTMNAGAYIGEMSFVVARTQYLSKAGEIHTLEGEQHRFGKRRSVFQAEGGIILSSELRLQEGGKAEILEKMEEFKKQRRDKQPLEMPSAGSVFKRPEGYYAGKLVQDCGLRGFGIGGAQVSCKHCGFIVNTGNAVAGDITALIHHIQNEVLNRFGVELQTEVRIVGEE